MSTTASPARPDLAAYHEIVRMEPAVVVRELADILGKKITAFLAGVKDTRTVDAWIAGRPEGRKFDVERLRLALRIAKMILAVDDKRVAQAWFGGLNPQLGDRSPARLLRDGDPLVDGEHILSAARAFLAGG